MKSMNSPRKICLPNSFLTDGASPEELLFRLVEAADVAGLVERALVLALATACVLDGRDVIPFRGCVAVFNRRTKTVLLPVMGRFSVCKRRRRTSSERDVRFSEPRDLRGFDDTRGRAIKKL